MKKSKNIIPALILSIAYFFAGCTDELLKSDYDYQQDPTKLPSITLSLGEVTGASVECTSTINLATGESEYIERGFVCAKDMEFTNGVISKAITSTSFSGIVVGLDELTDYFVKAYVITKDGIAYSNSQVISTPIFINPLLFLCGTYIESDYNYDDGLVDTTSYGYVEILPIEKNPIQLKIRNFWAGDTVIVIDVDLKTKKIGIAPQTIYVHDSYGDAKGYPILHEKIDKTGSPIMGTINANGEINLSAWAPTVDAGYFVIYSRTRLVPATSSLAGIYTENDYVWSEDTISSTYQDAVVVTSVLGELDKIKIINFWNTGFNDTIVATVDFTTKQISIAPQVMFTHPVYGDYSIKPFDNSTGDVLLGVDVSGSIDDNGAITINTWMPSGSVDSIYNKFTKSVLTLPIGSQALSVKAKIKRLR